MIVKFHARGKGGGSGPVDYLLGRERNREGATVLQGNPEEVRELIDATPFAKKYTSGVLSFAEKELPPGGREKVMASFERVLMPGLEKNQYSILWVEHQDKGRLELNFVIPNMELQTGKRLQPYYDRASSAVPGHEETREYEYSPRAERESGEAEREDMGRALSRGQQRTFSGVAEGDESRNELDEGQRQTERSETGAGVTEHDGAGKTFAERIRATATGLYAAAERMGERLRGIAENVFAYATGQRDAERASHAVESAGAALERADRTLEPVIQREQEIRDERLMQEREHELSLERERQPEIQERTLDGPSLGW